MSEPRSWIKVGPNGTFAASGKLTTTPGDIDDLFGAGMKGKPRLLIHVHGGLVTEADGKLVADSMAAHYGDATRAVSLVWETGVIETLRDNIAKISGTRTFKKALSWVLSKALRELIAVPGAKGNTTPLSQAKIEAMLETKEGVQELDDISRAETEKGDAETSAKGGFGELRTEDELTLELALNTSDLRIMIENEEQGAAQIASVLGSDKGAKGATFTVARLLAKVVIAVVRRYRAGTHHDPLPTAVEELLRAAYISEIGEFTWKNIKEKAERMWRDDGAEPSTEGHVGGYLLRKIEALQATNPQLVVDLVGHSAGSIVICAMLNAIDTQHRKIRIRNIVFLAPAVRLDTFRDAAIHSDLFYCFRMYTMTDDVEKADKLVGEIYPRSLLFLVSGLFEDTPGTPLAGLARHISGRTRAAGEEFDNIRAWLAEQNRLVFSPSDDGALEGFRSKSRRHGDFDNDPLTLASLLNLAGVGQ